MWFQHAFAKPPFESSGRKRCSVFSGAIHSAPLKKISILHLALLFPPPLSIYKDGFGQMSSAI